jgi:hypothetical protein
MRNNAVKVRVWVHKSRIAGLGLFAAQDIKQGTRILPYIGEKIPKDESTRRLAQGNVLAFPILNCSEYWRGFLADTA